MILGAIDVTKNSLDEDPMVLGRGFRMLGEPSNWIGQVWPGSNHKPHKASNDLTIRDVLSRFRRKFEDSAYNFFIGVTTGLEFIIPKRSCIVVVYSDWLRNNFLLGLSLLI